MTAPSGPYATHPHGWVDGIDVSTWQAPKKINWPITYGEGGVRFAWIKASEATFEDGAFREHEDRSTVDAYVNILTGAYHFLRNNVDPIKQAEKFASLVPFADDLPPMLDVEDPYFDFKSPPPWGELMERSKRVESVAHACATEVERLTGRRVVVYTGGYYFAHRTESLAQNRPLFVAQYLGSGLRTPKLPLAWSRWDIWQWAGDDGRVEGVEGPCDRNYFQGDRDALDRFCSASYLGETREIPAEHATENTELGSAWKLFRAVDAIRDAREDLSDEQEIFHVECFNFGMNRGEYGCTDG